MRQTQFLLLLACGARTGLVYDTEAEEAGSHADGGSDARETSVAKDGGLCNVTAPFGAPTLIPGIDNVGSEFDPRLSADELTIYYARHEYPRDIYVATRSTRTLPFGTAIPLSTQNSPSDDVDVMVSASGLEIFFASDRPSTLSTVHDIYRGTRASTASAFGAPTKVTGVNTGLNDGQPYLRSDGAELWFMREGSGVSSRGWDILRGDYSSGVVTNVQALKELNTNFDDGFPVLAWDALTIYFSSSRFGSHDVFRAQRATKDVAFGSASVVTELSTPSVDVPSWLSPDGCRLYMYSDRGRGWDMYVAER